MLIVLFVCVCARARVCTCVCVTYKQRDKQCVTLQVAISGLSLNDTRQNPYKLHIRPETVDVSDKTDPNVQQAGRISSDPCGQCNRTVDCPWSVARGDTVSVKGDNNCSCVPVFGDCLSAPPPPPSHADVLTGLYAVWFIAVFSVITPPLSRNFSFFVSVSVYYAHVNCPLSSHRFFAVTVSPQLLTMTGKWCLWLLLLF